MFNHDYFVRWLEKLLEALDARGVKNAVIVMDNARYHKKQPADTPNASSKKAVLREACTRYGIAVGERDTKSVMWEKLKTHIAENVHPVIVQMAAEKGHEVVFTPPHYSDLQPIESVWGIVKGVVGRQYTTETTFRMALERLMRAFTDLTTHAVSSCVKKANDNLEELYRDIQDEDEDGDDEDGSAGDSEDEEDEEEGEEEEEEGDE